MIMNRVCAEKILFQIQEDIKAICTVLRKNSKEVRLVRTYNGSSSHFMNLRGTYDDIQFSWFDGTNSWCTPKQIVEYLKDGSYTISNASELWYKTLYKLVPLIELCSGLHTVLTGIYRSSNPVRSHRRISVISFFFLDFGTVYISGRDNLDDDVLCDTVREDVVFSNLPEMIEW